MAEHFAMRSAARPASAEAVAEEQAVEEAMAAEAAEVQRQAASVAEAVAEAAEERAEAERQAVAVDANGEVTLPTLSPLSPPPLTPAPPTSAGGAFSPKVGGSKASRDWWRKFRQAEAAWEARQPGYVLTDEERRAEMIAVSIPMGAGAVSQASPCGGPAPMRPTKLVGAAGHSLGAAPSLLWRHSGGGRMLRTLSSACRRGADGGGGGCHQARTGGTRVQGGADGFGGRQDLGGGGGGGSGDGGGGGGEGGGGG